MKMKYCVKCGNPFPSYINYKGKRLVFNKRKYCFSCSPYKSHNTKDLVRNKNGLICLSCENELVGNQTKYCSAKCKSKVLYNEKGRDIRKKKAKTMSNEEREKKNRNKREINRKCENNKRTIINGIWGSECFICKSKKTRSIHRKDGKKHKLISNMNLNELNDIKEEKEIYIALCISCHTKVHWCMTYLKMDWNDILNRL